MFRSKTKKRASKSGPSRRRRPVLAYPLVIFLLLCAGAFLAAWTFKAGADNIFVTAKVSGPHVTHPATITTPASGSHFSSIPIAVSGSCPANAAYIEIFDNNVMRGTAICSSGSYSLMIDLFPGLNDLTAHAFNLTDDEGPVSAVTTVTYNLPQPAASSSPASSSAVPSANPLTLNTAFVYKGYYVGQQVSWPLQISGGTPPYAISVDWGDGTSDLMSRSTAGQFQVDHTYGQPNSPNGSYTIKVKATDTDGQNAFIQFFLIVNDIKDTSLSNNIFSKPPPSIKNDLKWLWVAWPVYVLIVMMAFSYLLGEREELIILRKRGVMRR